jgi:hypothetical protein
MSLVVGTIQRGIVFFIILLKNQTMRGILYLIAVILVIGWLLGVFVYSATGLIHILLVIAIIALILGFIRRGTV